jgi:peroxiredoxin
MTTNDVSRRPELTEPTQPTGKIAPGDLVRTRQLITIRSKSVQVPAADGLTHLQFRRFAGCPICNLHLQSMARRYDEIVAAGIREVAVFHSSTADMLPHQGQLPFAVIADPTRALYAEFGVEKSARSLLHPRAWIAPLKPRTYPMILRAVRAGGSPAPRHGDSPLGLPADFLIEPGGRVMAAHYGRLANDQWSVDELLDLAR